MQQNKIMPVAVWIVCLTIAAYVLAQAAAVIVRKNLDAALKNAPAIAQNRQESTAPALPRSNASGRSKPASVPENDAARDMKVEQVSETSWILDRASMPARSRDLGSLLMQVRAVPYMKKGRTAGFRITRISKGSLYEKIGFRNGDVLLRVNTHNLDNPAKLVSLYQELRTKRHISVLLSRNGQNQMFDYDIR